MQTIVSELPFDSATRRAERVRRRHTAVDALYVTSYGKVYDSKKYHQPTSHRLQL